MSEKEGARHKPAHTWMAGIVVRTTVPVAPRPGAGHSPRPRSADAFPPFNRPPPPSLHVVPPLLFDLPQGSAVRVAAADGGRAGDQRGQGGAEEGGGGGSESPAPRIPAAPRPTPFFRCPTTPPHPPPTRYQAIFSAAGLVLAAQVLEPVWGAREVATYAAVVSAAGSATTLLAAYVAYVLNVYAKDAGKIM